MAHLNVAFSKSSFTFGRAMTFSSQGNHVPAGALRLPSLEIRSCPLTIRCCSSEIARSDFPSSFKFGAASSALQTEGYANEGGRGPSTWDYMLGDLPAVQSYTKYKEDVWCLKNMNADVYRFSISWSRILPSGKKSGGINQEGIDFYNNLIDELLANGIEPFVTLFHFDMPSALQHEYNGLLSSQFVNDFNDYANICFNAFGDRVKHWATFNEPSVYCETGYIDGLSGVDDPARYPYMAAHNLLLAHATAVKTYRDNYKATQNGKIGISLVTTWLLPLTDSPADASSSQRLWDFIVGWFLDPIVIGDYPFSMKSIVRERLPQFSDREQQLLRGSYDFIGINYYTSRYTKSLPFSANDVPISYAKDQYVEMIGNIDYLSNYPINVINKLFFNYIISKIINTFQFSFSLILAEKDGVSIGPQSEGMDFMYAYPKGLTPILLNLKLKYNNPLIYITENGYPEKRDDSISIEDALQDDVRIQYMKDHLYAVRRALRDGVNVNGYFVWSLMDNMEVKGVYYTVRFGLNYTDYSNDCKRVPKKSATWLKNFMSPHHEKNETHHDKGEHSHYEPLHEIEHLS